MSTSTPKKPPGAGGAANSSASTARKTPANSSTSTAPNGAAHNRSPSRMAAAQNSSTTSATGTASAGVNRTRSVRNGAGTPVSARAAARKPANTEASSEDDAKAELQAQLTDLQSKLAESESALSTSQKQADVLQIKLDEALKEQSMLEENVHEQTERLEELENERREHQRGRREMEQIYEAERAAMTKEKEESARREEEMQGSIVRMKEALQARDRLEEPSGMGERGSRASLSRTSSHRASNSHSPNPPELSPDARQFAPSSLQRSDSRSSSRLVMQKDKIIESLRLELAEAQIKLVELENKGGGHVQVLEKEMYDLKIQNARLMEENESFQLLLQEKTLNGDLLRAPSDDKGSRPPSSRNVRIGGASLADELHGEEMNSVIEGDSAATDNVTGGPDSKEKRLQQEANTLKDQNKALTLYINNIISRLLQHEQFEAILDKTPDLMAGPGAASTKYPAAPATEKELPPPPPPKDEKPLPVPSGQTEEGEQPQGMGFLQRAGSVLKRARPQSVIQTQPSGDQQQPRLEEPTVHENPQTAPQIPISRTRSTRKAPSGHKRANSDWSAASVVTNMYKGTPSQSGPLSPGLGSPTAGGRASPFFTMNTRQPSGSSVPTISEADKPKEPEQQKENIPATAPSHLQRDSKVDPDPKTSLDALPPTALAQEEASSNPSSPPRSVASSGDRESQLARGGSVMMGSKPRPLRLVQENSDADERARKQANRGSWFGWMNNVNVKNLAGGTPPSSSQGGERERQGSSQG